MEKPSYAELQKLRALDAPFNDHAVYCHIKREYQCVPEIREVLAYIQQRASVNGLNNLTNIEGMHLSLEAIHVIRNQRNGDIEEMERYEALFDEAAKIKLKQREMK